jgi:phage/plasmid-associated DNA primase
MSSKLAIYKPQFNIIAQMNRILETDETGNAAQRRFKFIHFPFNFVENPTKPHERPLNKDLKNIIETDEILYKSFMNLLLKKAFENKNKKIIIPKVYEDFKNEYFETNDIITLYINRRLIKTENEKDFIRVSDVFEDFKQDKEKTEYMTAKKFTMLLNEKLTLIKSNGYKIIRGYKFIKIENKNEDEEGFINDDSDDDGGFMPKEKNNIKSNNNNNKVDINNDVYENNTFNKSFLDDDVDD